MTLIQLEYIVALHSFKHFGKAAAYCNIAQPSLSLQVQKLEEELQTIIFTRNCMPIVTTETGEIIIEQAKKILAEAGLLDQLIQQQKNTLEGHLKIGIIPTLAPYLLPLFLFDFIKKHPAVRLNISELTTEKIIESLKNGSLDVGIMATPLAHADLQEEVLFNEEFIAYVSKKEKVFTKKYIIPTDIDPNSLWLAEEGHCLRTQTINLCELQKNSTIEKHLEYETGSIETLKKLVEKNGGITLLPELATLDISAGKKAMLRYFKNPAPAREISLVTLKTFVKKRLTAILKESIIEHLPTEIKKNKVLKKIGLL